MILALLLACGSVPEDAGVAPPIELRVALDGAPKKGGGALIVQAEYDADGAVSLPEPAAQGLTFEPDGPPRTERIGDRAVVTQRYVFRGSSGNYEIPPLVAHLEGEGGGTDASSTSVFVDIDAKPPREGELVDIVEPPPVRRIPWAAIAGIGALFAGGLWLAFRPRKARELPRTPPVPPDVVALRAWDAVRRDATLPVDEKAKRLAALFRVYVEAVLGFEATSRTTTEIVGHLQGLVHLPEGNVPRARRILRATDRVKFAEERPAGEWLEELDADLRAFVDSTRPSAWKVESRQRSA
jgi:hypothetical protein